MKARSQSDGKPWKKKTRNKSWASTKKLVVPTKASKQLPTEVHFPAPDTASTEPAIKIPKASQTSPANSKPSPSSKTDKVQPHPSFPPNLAN